MSKMARKRSALRTVDPQAELSEDAEVYEDANGVVWHFMLIYTDLTYGVKGNNKYYMAQLIQDGEEYMVWRRWGRVGAKIPQRSLEEYGTSLTKAQASFQKKFNDKSGNEWPLQGGFERVPRKYALVELDDQEPMEESGRGDEEAEEATSSVPSKLDERVQDVMKLICDADLINQEMAAMKLDLKRLPLGRLSQSQITQAYSLLDKLSNAVKEIERLSNENDDEEVKPATTSTRARRSTRPKRAVSSTRTKRLRVLKDQLKMLSNEFYILVPHDFGFTAPPPIDTMDDIKLKIDLLEVLADIEISQKLQQEKRNAARADLNPLDAQYQVLNTDMVPLLETDDEFKTIQRYVETTHAPTHIQYKLQIRSVLKIHRREEDEFTSTLDAVSNHRLLWHGSRLCNVVGILSKGLRVAPPEAPTNGYMFGKGIYFADSVSKSANYCWTTPEQPRGVVILAEVALGDMHPALEAVDLNYDMIKQAHSCDSLHGLGRMAAPTETYETMQDGVVVPIGEFEPTGVTDGELLYNEFVVYRKEQVRLRYLVSLDFLYETDE
ncbi:hypothetical protein Poli38472_007606 [Pythium oligandrum]|uniref:Poly [ADP-ribose] polymerase n=1 Tax=Pythium oligandrum TaxID=41045 RepID=A0A8K1FP24_PYTOL|nr:hypothetical protein Poli38472_007606 [Pythium oligandrum]|eukprot:TMW67934.1 hypothetical protein Poli38472_007606 [Pythium oligandrum]